MLKIIHRINSIKELQSIPIKYGVEVDVRADGKELILTHDPFRKGEKLTEYLNHYHHKFIIFNIKEAGIEGEVITLAKKFRIRNFFLLDVEFPYLYKASRRGIKKIAVRYSEDEAIETVLKYKGKVDWVWIDTITRLPLSKKTVRQLNGFKTCLVCPERWGRPEDIVRYKKKLALLHFRPDALMTARSYADQW